MYIIGLLSIDMPIIISDKDYAYQAISDFLTLYKPRNNYASIKIKIWYENIEGSYLVFSSKYIIFLGYRVFNKAESCVLMLTLSLLDSR